MKEKSSFRERLPRFWQYIKDRTGFFAYTDAEGKVHRGKTLWHWMQLLVIPAVLAIGATLFNQAQRNFEFESNQQAHQIEQEIAEDRNHETALQNYLDKMTELLLEEGLRQSPEESEVRSVARSRTLTTLRSLDGTRKGLLLRFLYESKLLDKENPIISLEDANLTGAELIGANLGEANLGWANLREADLLGADLTEAHLIGANLGEAFLARAFLVGADLTEAHLDGAFLVGADLTEAHLTGAHLSRANLSEADLTGANLTGAVYSDQTEWPEGFDPDAAGATKAP